MKSQDVAQHNPRARATHHPRSPGKPSPRKPRLADPLCPESRPNPGQRPGSTTSNTAIQRTPSLPHEEGQFMGDTYLWATSLSRLQRMATNLEHRLETHRTQIQPDKTQVIQSHTTSHPSTIKIGKETIQARPPDTPISAFNQPVSFHSNESHLAAHLATKARIAFNKQSHILTSDPLLAKLKLIATTVKTSAPCSPQPTQHSTG